MKSISSAKNNTPDADRFLRHLRIMLLLKKKALHLLLLFSFFLPAVVLAQTTINGTVRDETGTALPGASIRVQGDTAVGTVTDASGNYVLNIALRKIRINGHIYWLPKTGCGGQ